MCKRLGGRDWRGVFLGLSSLLACVMRVQAGEVGELTLTTERVTIFKDGYGLVIKRAVGKADESGCAFTGEIPDTAVLGCFWATSTEPNLKSMRAEIVESRDHVKTRSRCADYGELLRANLGKTLTLERQSREKVEGKVSAVLGSPPKAASTNGRQHGALVNPSYWHGSHHRSQPASSPLGVTETPLDPAAVLVVIETDDGEVVLRVAEITSVSGSDLTLDAEHGTLRVGRQKRLTFEFGETAAGRDVSLTLLHFSEGIRWIPTYSVELIDDSRAAMALQAEVLNEMEDLKGVAVDFVVGVPNFRFKKTVSPFALEPYLRQTLRAAAPQLMGGNQYSQFSNASFHRRSSEWRGAQRRESADGSGMLSLAPELAAKGTEDLFTYSFPHFTLKKGGRAGARLFTAEVPMRHLYTYDVVVSRDAWGRSWSYSSPGNNHGSPLVVSYSKVWHQIELSNTTKCPFTTGPALILKDGLPIGQELLTYTPVRGRVLLPLTVAIDIRGSFDEVVTKRQPKAHSNYTRLDVRGTVHLTNYLAKEVELNVSVQFGGYCEEASDDGKTKISPFRNSDWSNYHRVSRDACHSHVSWKLTLRPGESKEMTCDYYWHAAKP